MVEVEEVEGVRVKGRLPWSMNPSRVQGIISAQVRFGSGRCRGGVREVEWM